ncbi:HsdM family class I SAM-dependent methyltransferase [Pseudorhodoplanes sp.]|uniref:HsdM family class I SAM-dependent methyltransferase n=1 Tax=Pseudorhodoplanes sp. TaxID=1934341 RepID=UPI003D0BA644
MTVGRPIDAEWKERLGLLNRRSPELYETSESAVDIPHALAIRAALDDLGLSAVFCVQGVPTVAILDLESFDRAHVMELHAALWNQGLASLFLVIAENTLRAYSLGRTPYRDGGATFDDRCLIDALKATDDALRFRNLLYGAESGRLWKEHADYFRPKERIDQVLLDNLNETHRLLCAEKLESDAAQALLIQSMFIAYLEDRGIITTDYFEQVSNRRAGGFTALLEHRDTKLLRSLFSTLRKDFNGDLFVAPCSFERQKKAPELDAAHLELLARFREGREELGKGGQLRFWGYDFRYIPIELVSAVYDRFLGEREDERREQGAYYTPMFLADTVVSQVWEFLTPDVKEKGRYLDPACGSGVFLVRSFQRLCEHWRATHRSRTIRWDSLLAILQRVHGWDINGSAVRVAVFSLYVALLEEVSPPDIKRLIKRGKLLPELWDKTLVCKDFFSAPEGGTGFNVVIGNPPWSSRRGPRRPSVLWSEKHQLPLPGREDAWAFVWKAGRHLAPGGLVAFLLPAMGFLHNHAANTVAARNRLLSTFHIRRIINFADLRFQLFEHALRPTALIIYGAKKPETGPYRFDYWVPKADLNLRIKRVITLSSADKLTLTNTAVTENPLLFKQRLWMREPEAKLFHFLSGLPTLGHLVRDYGGIRRRKQAVEDGWVIGQGYQPFNGSEGSYTVSKFVGKLPDLPIAAFRRLAQPTKGLTPARSSRVRRPGFEAGFEGIRILVPRGVETSHNRLRASYTETALTFQDIIQAISVPQRDAKRARVLTALLNSRIAVWYAFHGTASFGADRPEVKQAELLKLPFPSPADLPEPKRAEEAAEKLASLISSENASLGKEFRLDAGDDGLLNELDRLAYDYFCLSDDEIALIDDTTAIVLPSVQPHEGTFPRLWNAPTGLERETYAKTLLRSMRDWFDSGTSITATLEAASSDLAILCLSLDGKGSSYSEASNSSVVQTLGKIASHINQPLSGNFQLMPDLRIFVGKSLYLIKPMQLRFWMRSAALADADAIAMDLQDVVELDERRGRA